MYIIKLMKIINLQKLKLIEDGFTYSVYMITPQAHLLKKKKRLIVNEWLLCTYKLVIKM